MGANGDETADDTPAQGGLSLEGIGNEIATALASKEDRRQIEQSSSGDANNRGVLMAGVYDKKTGDIESLAFAEATEALKLAQKKTTVGERAFCIKRILDTNNKKRPPNSTRALFRALAALAVCSPPASQDWRNSCLPSPLARVVLSLTIIWRSSASPR